MSYVPYGPPPPPPPPLPPLLPMPPPPPPPPGHTIPLPPRPLNLQRKLAHKRVSHGRDYSPYHMLPKLDEMVLLSPVFTTTEALYVPSSEQENRCGRLSSELEKYNRWLTFVNASSPGKDIRNAAFDLQQTVYDTSVLIAQVMMQFDRKVALLQDQTKTFADAVLASEGCWESGDWTALECEEMDRVFKASSSNNADRHLEHIRELIHRAADDDPDQTWPGYNTRSPERLLEKIIRLIYDVKSLRNGAYEAFQLFIFARAKIVPRWAKETADSFFPSDYPDLTDYDRMEDEIYDHIKTDDREPGEGSRCRSTTFYGFAKAKRQLWSSMPARCRKCRLRGSLNETCDRELCRELLEVLQKRAYGEVKSGVMLTLPAKLPKELCLLVFEHTMAVEELPLDPLVWEMELLGGTMEVKGAVKKEYRCPVNANT